MEAISHAGTSLGILATDGILLAAERRNTNKLLDEVFSSEKIYKLNDDMVCSVAGITSDANVLTNELRLIAQRYLLQYGESIPCEQLVSWLCDVKQAYTQYGGEIIFVFLELGASHHFKGGILAPVWFKRNCMEHYLEKQTCHKYRSMTTTLDADGRSFMQPEIILQVPDIRVLLLQSLIEQ